MTTSAWPLAVLSLGDAAQSGDPPAAVASASVLLRALPSALEGAAGIRGTGRAGGKGLLDPGSTCAAGLQRRRQVQDRRARRRRRRVSHAHTHTHTSLSEPPRGGRRSTGVEATAANGAPFRAASPGESAACVQANVVTTHLATDLNGSSVFRSRASNFPCGEAADTSRRIPESTHWHARERRSALTLFSANSSSTKEKKASPHTAYLKRGFRSYGRACFPLKRIFGGTRRVRGGTRLPKRRTLKTVRFLGKRTDEASLVTLSPAGRRRISPDAAAL